MLKTVLTPKNIVFAIFVITITSVSAYLLLLSTGFKFPTQESKQEDKKETTEEVNPTGELPNSVVGPIKKLDAKTREVVVLNTRDNKNYKIIVDKDASIFEKNKEVSFSKLKVGVFIAVYSKEKFVEGKDSNSFEYITITGNLEPENKGDPAKGGFPTVGGGE